MSTSAVNLENLVARAHGLCSLPAVAMKVLELTNNPQVDTRELKQCIENDPALTGKILRVVNSSLFGLTREVSDLNQALALLGTKPLKMLVLGFSLPSGLFAGLSGEVLGRYWRRTLTKAVAAREISESLWRLPGDEAFICGLLQDLGLLLLVQELGQPYIRFLEKVQTAGRDLAALEVEAMGFDHATLSARLLKAWGLPEVIVEAVRGLPPGEEPPSDKPLSQIVQLAEYLARLVVDGNSDVLPQLLEFGRLTARLRESQLADLTANLGHKVEQLADVLSLQLPPGVDYRDVLVQSQQRLAQLSAEAAEELLRRQQEAAHVQESLVCELQELSVGLAGPARSRPSPPPAPRPAPTPLKATEITPVAPLPAEMEPDSGLVLSLEAAVTACRQARCSLSLLLVEIAHADQILLSGGVEGWNLVRRLVRTLCEKLEHPDMQCRAYGETGFALILPDCDRRQLAETGNLLLDEVRRATGRTGWGKAISLSAGAATVALPPKNFPAEDLLHAAVRCLNGSRASGGNVLKSIEIY